MLEEIRNSIERAKRLRSEALTRFHIGAVAYPLYQSWSPVIWGTIVNIDPVAYKITVNLNGIERQYDPEELVLTNPEEKTQFPNKQAIEVAERIIKDDVRASLKKAMYWKEKPSVFRVSKDEQEEGTIRCPNCREIMRVRYNKEDRTHYYVCKNCGKSVPLRNVRYASAPKQLDPKLYTIKSAETAFSWILKKIEPVSKGIKRDTAWQEIRRVEKAIQDLGVDYQHGKVDSSRYEIDGGYKSWDATISFVNIVGKKIVLDIQIMASACGTVDNPWGAYDITIILKRGQVKNQ